jgi:hypothetical protein
MAWCFGALLVIALTALLIRWAKRPRSKTQAVAGTMLLMFGLGLTPDVDRQRIEDAREGEKAKKGGQSGDPPDPEV